MFARPYIRWLCVLWHGNHFRSRNSVWGGFVPLQFWRIRLMTDPPPFSKNGIEVTAAQFGIDRSVYSRLISALVTDWRYLLTEVLAPLHFPSHPVVLARFGILALQSAAHTCSRLFHNETLRSLFACVAAHAAVPLNAFCSGPLTR